MSCVPLYGMTQQAKAACVAGLATHVGPDKLTMLSGLGTGNLCQHPSSCTVKVRSM